MYIGNNFKQPETFFTHTLSGMAKFIVEPDQLNNCTAPSEVRSLIDTTTGDVTGVDLIISSVQWPYADVFKMEPYVGNRFHMHYLGKGAITATITGSIIDLKGSPNKKNLMLLYEHLFRATAVARYKTPPILKCMGYYLMGCILSLEIVESSNKQDSMFFTMQYQIIHAKIVNTDNLSNVTEVEIKFI